jgi:hypothetical protein
VLVHRRAGLQACSVRVFHVMCIGVACTQMNHDARLLVPSCSVMHDFFFFISVTQSGADVCLAPLCGHLLLDLSLALQYPKQIVQSLLAKVLQSCLVTLRPGMYRHWATVTLHSVTMRVRTQTFPAQSVRTGHGLRAMATVYCHDHEQKHGEQSHLASEH